MPFHVLRRLAALLLLAGAVPVVAAPPNFTISGRVTRADGTGIAGVVVGEFRYGGFHASRYATTDAAGDYVLAFTEWSPSVETAVRAGTYGLNLVSEAYPDVPCLAFENAPCLGAPQLLTLDADVPRTGVDFVLGPGAELTGRVLDRASGVPLQYAGVGLRSETGYTRNATTDATGRFRETALVPGIYTAHATHDGYAAQVYSGIDCFAPCAIDAGTPIVATVGIPATADFALRRVAHLAIDATLGGAPLSSVEATVYPASGAIGAPQSLYRANAGEPFRVALSTTVASRIVLRAEGAYARVIGGGDCELDCGAAVPTGTAFVAPADGAVVPVGVALTRLPRLTGTVRDASTGAPIAGARVAGRRGILVNPDTTTRADGTFELGGLLGEYDITVASSLHVDQTHPGVPCENAAPSTCAGRTTLAFGLATGDRQVDYTLEPSARMTGRLTRGGQPLHPNPGHRPRLLDAKHVEACCPVASFVDGGYVLTDVPPGTWHVAILSPLDGTQQLYPDITCTSNDFQSLFYWAQCDFARARTVTIAPGATVSGIDFDVVNYGARVARVVDAATGAPIAGVAVDVWDTGGRHVGARLTGADGRALITADLPYGVSSTQLFVSTDNEAGYYDVVYDALGCVPGTSVYRGGCALAGATAVTYPNPWSTQPEIRIALTRDTLFGSDFE